MPFFKISSQFPKTGGSMLVRCTASGGLQSKRHGCLATVNYRSSRELTVILTTCVYVCVCVSARVCEHNRSGHKEIIQNEEPSQNKKGNTKLTSTTGNPAFNQITQGFNILNHVTNHCSRYSTYYTIEHLHLMNQSTTEPIRILNQS